jgi:hypothetical protein
VKSYKLQTPVDLLDKEGNTVSSVSELQFREKVVSGDLRGMKISSLSDPTTDDILKIAGRLCAQPDVVMARLSFPDLLGVTEIVGGFLSSGLPTGNDT